MFVCRLELTVILMHDELFVPVTDLNDDYTDTSQNKHDWIDFEMVMGDKDCQIILTLSQEYLFTDL